MDNKKLLTDLLEQPGKVRSEHIAMLKEFLQEYPYAQSIHMLLAKADATFLPKAALYSNGTVLYSILQTAFIAEPEVETEENNHLADQEFADVDAESTPDEQAVIDEIEEVNAESSEIEEEESVESKEEVTEEFAEIDAESTQDEEEIFDEIEEVNTESFKAKAEEGVEVKEELSEAEFAEIDAESTQDEQEIFDEIGEINSDAIPQVTQAVNIETPKNLPGIDDQLMDAPANEDLFIESVASMDFFAFEQKTITNVVAEAPEIETVIPDNADVNFVSKYDDDQLPYTFLWWLAKTRKEHEQIFQPYAQPKPGVAKQEQTTQRNQQPAFQQQVVEHIFHIQTPFEVADHLAEYPSGEIKDVKGAEIIERFLKEDPTIKPPKPELIDNENKAKKSAEDNYDLVSETLAKIYIEQMLYHKAIDTYKKLSLKYPEKSGYFADLIQSIEKKF